MLIGYEQCPLCKHVLEEDDVVIDYKTEYENINERHDKLREQIREHTKTLITLMSVSIGFLNTSEPEKALIVLLAFSKNIDNAVEKSKIELN